ncbi:hypothetical protein EDC96DRAFT_524310 [Choanephora cucurbitarum]|nr:hypothetical protein EDC96DRAFT_524310 [Choanephora cucurbitarum]
MDLVKRFYPRSSKNSVASESKLISLYRKRSKKSSHHRNKVLLSNSDDSEEEEEENDHGEDNRMELYKKKHQQKIKAVETHNDIQRLNKSIQLIALSASNDSDDSFYHYHTYPNHYAANQEYHAIPSSLNHSSTATEKKNKQVDTCAKLCREGDQESPICSPFTKRPEFIENNYIPLPTVTRKYIDPPPDVILDAIPSLVYPSKTRHTSQEAEAVTNVSQSNSNTTSVAKEKPKVNLKINTSQLNTQHNQVKPTNTLDQERQVSMPDINTWLSQTISNH